MHRPRDAVFLSARPRPSPRRLLRVLVSHLRAGDRVGSAALGTSGRGLRFELAWFERPDPWERGRGAIEAIHLRLEAWPRALRTLIGIHDRLGAVEKRHGPARRRWCATNRALLRELVQALQVHEEARLRRRASTAAVTGCASTRVHEVLALMRELRLDAQVLHAGEADRYAQLVRQWACCMLAAHAGL